MAQRDALLVEIGTEELPPKALKKLSQAFKDGIQQGLDKSELRYGDIQSFASPRRLAVIVNDLQAQQENKMIEKRGPAIAAAFDKDGNPTQACQGFARSCNTEVSQLQTLKTEKGEWLVYRFEQEGKAIQEIIADVITQSLNRLPIPKRMRWGDKTAEFVRPIHWVLLLFGKNIIKANIMGLEAQNHTFGHRFHHPQAIPITHADAFESKLESEGHVIAHFEKRRDSIKKQVIDCGQSINGTTIIPEALLDEVTALVEWPVALAVNFEKHFLEVPAEALISSMHDHQKCFHVVDDKNQLMPYFITVSNIDSQDKQQVIAGNARVMRARLSDAQFFYQTDLKHNLESLAEKLKHVVFQAKLGNLYEKSTRIAKLAEIISPHIDGNIDLASRAGQLCKADLMSDMVGEFPELQGIMGYYYALHEHEPEEVALALKEHYMPRFAGDELPQTKTGCAVAIADRIDTLVGIFGINQAPTGEKDPFGLRRAALGILRIIIEKQLPIDILKLIKHSIEQYQIQLPTQQVVDDCFNFILERLKTWYQEKGINAKVFAAVMAKKPSKPLDFQQRILAVNHFCQLPEADALAAANKRVSKLLLKEGKQDITRQIQVNLFEKDAEKQLAKSLEQKSNELEPLFAKADYNEALTRLSSLREPVDQFFDEVMVMVDDEDLRNNRLALLANLRDLFLKVADISLL